MYVSCNFQYIGKKGAYDSPGGASSQASMETKRRHTQTNSLELNLSTGLLTGSLQISTVRNQQIGHGRMNGLYQWTLPANCLDEMLSWQHETSAVCTSLAVSHLYILPVSILWMIPRESRKQLQYYFVMFLRKCLPYSPKSGKLQGSLHTKGFRLGLTWAARNAFTHWVPGSEGSEEVSDVYDSETLKILQVVERWRFQTFARGTWHLGLRCGFRGHLVVPGELGGWVPAKQVPRTATVPTEFRNQAPENRFWDRCFGNWLWQGSGKRISRTRFWETSPGTRIGTWVLGTRRLVFPARATWA